MLFCSIATTLKFNGQTLAKIFTIGRRFHKIPLSGSRFVPYEQRYRQTLRLKNLFFRKLAKSNQKGRQKVKDKKKIAELQTDREI